MKYRRIAIFSVCIFLALLVPGAVLASLLGWKPSLFGSSLEAIRRNFHLFDHLLTGVAAGLAYFFFLRPLSDRLIAHAVIAYLAVEAMQIIGGLLIGDAITNAFNLSVSLTDAIYAAIGVALVYGWRSMKGGKMALSRGDP